MVSKKGKSEVKPSLEGWRLPLKPASPFFQRRNKWCFLIKYFPSSNFFIKLPEYRTRCSRRTYLVDCRILGRMSIAIILWNINIFLHLTGKHVICICSVVSAPKNNIRVIPNFFENSRRYLQVRVHHRYQRHRWQIIGTNRAAYTSKWTWRQKFIYMLTLQPKYN